MEQTQHNVQTPDTFLQGVKDCIPTLLGYISIGVAFGVVGIASGISVLEVFLLSVLVYAGSAQFIFCGLYLAGAPVTAVIVISMIVLQSVVNRFGATVMAVYTITCKVDLIVSQLYGAISQSMITFAGQNFGAGNRERIKEGTGCGMKIVFIYNLIMVPLVCLFSKYIISFFVNDPAVIEIGRNAMRITAVMYFSLGMF